MSSSLSPLISIIVPAYNVETYIDRCMESLVNQTYVNIEIILVDDGATDSTGLKCEEEYDSEKKHYNIIKRRLEKGQHFRQPCLGCSEFPVKEIKIIEEFDNSEIDSEILKLGDVDLGFMSYGLKFKDRGIPKNNDWNNPIFSDKAETIYYRPHMINGVIDVKKYREVMKC